ncbi:MAG TPA: 50S ribosome-binding GTPase [Candidatus Wallbacteria bacterium]|nr:MAG: GTPase YlqF [bacterium ADurb.Bin243]HPG59079.1 50S ribosome-binding GTPase [Candidatus Wallbacteria bacterium]
MTMNSDFSDNMFNESNVNYELLKKIYEEFVNSTMGKLVIKISPKLKNELRDLIEILNFRPPRVMTIGRRGSGKSSLINAFLGTRALKVGSVIAQTPANEWLTIESGNKKIEILDSRGAGEGEKVKNAVHGTALESISAAIKEKYPDTILFLVKAKEVDANIEHDIEFLNGVYKVIKSNYSDSKVSVIGVVTQVDELDPIRVYPPFDNSFKQENIYTAVKHLYDMMYKYFDDKNVKLNVVPVSAYMQFDSDGRLVDDLRWNIDTLAEEMAKNIPSQAQMAFAKMTEVKKVQSEIAEKVVNIFTAITGTIGAEPIPAADLPILTSLQITMISMIAAVSGRSLELKSMKEMLAAIGINIGGAFILREIARALSKLWVGYGNAISGAIAGGTTKIYGRAAIDYFINNKDENVIRKTVDKELIAIQKV